MLKEQTESHESNEKNLRVGTSKEKDNFEIISCIIEIFDKMQS